MNKADAERLKALHDDLMRKHHLERHKRFDAEKEGDDQRVVMLCCVADAYRQGAQGVREALFEPDGEAAKKRTAKGRPVRAWCDTCKEMTLWKPRAGRNRMYAEPTMLHCRKCGTSRDIRVIKVVRR